MISICYKTSSPASIEAWKRRAFRGPDHQWRCGAHRGAERGDSSRSPSQRLGILGIPTTHSGYPAPSSPAASASNMKEMPGEETEKLGIGNPSPQELELFLRLFVGAGIKEFGAEGQEADDLRHGEAVVLEEDRGLGVGSNLCLGLDLVRSREGRRRTRCSRKCMREDVLPFEAAKAWKIASTKWRRKIRECSAAVATAEAATTGDPTAATVFAADGAAAAFHSPFLQCFAKAISQASAAPDNASYSLTHFLEHSCGLSPEAAVAAAKGIKLTTTENPRLILDLLEAYGFSKSQIAGFLTRYPRFLSSDPKNLRPKLDFYRSRMGLSDAALSEFLAKNPFLLMPSLTKTLEPNLEILRSILRDGDEVHYVVKGCVGLLMFDLSGRLPPRFEALRRQGATERVLFTLLKSHPRALVLSDARFAEIVAAAEKSGISPSSTLFAHALGVLAILPQKAKAKRVENYKSLGWSDDQVWEAFRRHPFVLSLSAELVKKKMEFFAEKLGWSVEYVAKRPIVLSLSFEKRILPRCLVLGILAAKGLVEWDVKVRHLKIVDRIFIAKFVSKYQSVVPELGSAIDGGLVELRRLAKEIKAEI